MVRITLSPEGQTSFGKLPARIRIGFDQILTHWQSVPRLRLPGEYRSHQLEGSRNLWTLKVGEFRGVFRWDGSEARFIRFGHFSTIYARLPK
jgi:hypothetical protein